MKRFIQGSLFFTSVFTLLLFSCSEGSCFEETESYVKATFYLINNETSRATAPDSLSLYGVGHDSIIYDNKKGVKIALIPLNSSNESSKFIMVINDKTDTIEFRYSSYPHLISKECGYTFYHHLDEVLSTDNSITDISISNPTITNLNVENIRIFF